MAELPSNRSGIAAHCDASREHDVTLEILRDVMSTEKVGDISLVDLYKDLGAADPGLIATALEVRARDAGTFLPDIWKIVSNDKG